MMPHSVCIIGNGPSAAKESNGQFIDRCDVVIRMGNYVIDGYEDCVGSKTDVYVSRWKKLERNFDRVRKIDIWLAYPSPPHDWCSHYPGVASTHRNSRAVKDLNVTYIPEDVQLAYKDIYYPYNGLLATSSDRRCNFNIPDTGTVAIDMACYIFTNSKIYVTGFDGYFLDTGYYFNRQRQLYKDYVNVSPILQQYTQFKKLVSTKRINVL